MKTNGSPNCSMPRELASCVVYRNGLIDRLITQRKWNSGVPGPLARLLGRWRYVWCRERLEWLWWNPIIKCNSRHWPLGRSRQIMGIMINGVEHPLYMLDPNRIYTIFGWGVAGGFELESFTRKDGTQGTQAIKRSNGRAVQSGYRWGRIGIQYTKETDRCKSES